MAEEQFRNLIIGTGEAGKFIAWTLAKQGERTASVERDLVGGACPNVACLPSKNFVFSARAAGLARHGDMYGFAKLEGPVDMAAVTRRKRGMVAGLQTIHLDNFASSGVELVRGEAQFVGPRTVAVAMRDGTERVISGERVFLNLGSRASIPKVAGLAESGPLTHVQALELERLPGHLVIVGGGYVGVEFAQAFRRFGSEVTVVQSGAQILANEDAEVAEAVTALLRDEGVRVVTGAKVEKVTGKSGERVTVQWTAAGGVETIEATDILVAAGRMPNTDRIALEKAGVAVNVRGFIQVDEKLRTSAADVWAMGDCAGSPQFTHVSYDDFRVVRDTLAGRERTTKDRLIPYCLFTDPELAHVGLSERQAKEQGVSHRVVRVAMPEVLRTRTMDSTRGFAKLLVGEDDRVLGFTALGADAPEMLSVVQTAMLGKVPLRVMADALFTHPTMAEGVGTLFARALAGAR